MPSSVVPCDLQRFTQAVEHSGTFVRRLWIQFAVSMHIFAFLSPTDHVHCSFICVVVQVDRWEVALGATEICLGLNLSTWSVPTPPVQAFSLISSSIGSVSDDD